MSDKSYDIEQLYIEGYSPTTIALMLDIPVDDVYNWIESVDLEWNTSFEEHSPYETINS